MMSYQNEPLFMNKHDVNLAPLGKMFNYTNCHLLKIQVNGVD